MSNQQRVSTIEKRVSKKSKQEVRAFILSGDKDDPSTKEMQDAKNKGYFVISVSFV